MKRGGRGDGAVAQAGLHPGEQYAERVEAHVAEREPGRALFVAQQRSERLYERQVPAQLSIAWRSRQKGVAGTGTHAENCMCFSGLAASCSASKKCAGVIRPSATAERKYESRSRGGEATARICVIR
jgi:hypothetical protein